ncbi:MAG: DUF1800 domain-containing protein [Sphingobacteriales bacterium]|nr:DUF1800 domain-containing protein [Sphingobacteriales bacterium]
MNQEVLHLLARATFGISAESITTFASLNRQQALDILWETSATPPQNLSLAPRRVPIANRTAQKTPEEIRADKLLMRSEKSRLNLLWLEHLARGKKQLLEKMTLFWHDHFACNIPNPTLMEQYIHTLRTHALGYFGDFLLAIIHEPAMIVYLNSRKNLKSSPNEDFARELLELFSIGIGNYSEKDIKELARVFTGWNFDGAGNFMIQEANHDSGIKTLMGESGNFSSEQVVNILLNRRETAQHITGKICLYYCGKMPPAEILNDLSERFFADGYHIGNLVRNILNSDWFYADEYRGNRIKSPIELLVGTMRLFKVDFHEPMAAVGLQKLMGQELLAPPNVAGWAQGTAWINLFTLTFRLNLFRNLLNKSMATVKTPPPLSDEGDEVEVNSEEVMRLLNIDVAPFIQMLEQHPTQQPAQQCAQNILLCSTSHLEPLFERWNTAFVQQKIGYRDIIINLLSMPEFQLN